MNDNFPEEWNDFDFDYAYVSFHEGKAFESIARQGRDSFSIVRTRKKKPNNPYDTIWDVEDKIICNYKTKLECVAAMQEIRDLKLWKHMHSDEAEYWKAMIKASRRNEQ